MSVKKFSFILKTAKVFCCQLTWKNMMLHYFGFHYVTCSQPLDLPCACRTFKKPMSSIGSVGSLVIYQIEYVFKGGFPVMAEMTSTHTAISIDDFIC